MTFPASSPATDTRLQASPLFPASVADDRFAPTLVLFLSLLALAIRIAVAINGGLWRDEALFLFIAESPSWRVLLETLQLRESHPPLFYALMRLWIDAAGAGDVAARALPILLGVATVPAIYYAGASLFSTRAGLLAATLAALSPVLTEYSIQVRPYSLMPLLALVSSYTLILGLTRGGLWVWAGHILSSLALIYTHHWAWLVVIGQFAVASMILLRVRPRAGAARAWGVAQLFIALGYLPWLWAFLFQAENAGHAPLIVSGWFEWVAFIALGAAHFLTSTLFRGTPEGYMSAVGLIGSLILASLIGILAGWVYSRRNRAHEQQVAISPNSPRVRAAPDVRVSLLVLTGVPATAWLCALVLSPRSNMLIAGCMATLVPSLLLAVSYWLSHAPARVISTVSIPIVAVILAMYILDLSALLRTPRSNAREIAGAVGGKTQPSDLVIVAPGWLASSFNRYYEPPVEQIDYPAFGRQRVFDFTNVRARMADERIFDRARRDIARARERGCRIWLITEPKELRLLSSDDMRRAFQTANYGTLATVRTSQLYMELKAAYGAPERTRLASDGPAPFENMHALLFSPGVRRP